MATVEQQSSEEGFTSCLLLAGLVFSCLDHCLRSVAHPKVDQLKIENMTTKAPIKFYVLKDEIKDHIAPNTKIYKCLKVILKVACYLPFVYLLTFYFYVLRTIIILNRMPTLDNPDPKELGFEIHRQLVLHNVQSPIVSLGVIFTLKLFLPDKEFRNVSRMHFVIFLIGIILMILHFLYSPFQEWFLD